MAHVRAYRRAHAYVYLLNRCTPLLYNCVYNAIASNGSRCIFASSFVLGCLTLTYSLHFNWIHPNFLCLILMFFFIINQRQPHIHISLCIYKYKYKHVPIVQCIIIGFLVILLASCTRFYCTISDQCVICERKFASALITMCMHRVYCECCRILVFDFLRAYFTFRNRLV